MLWLLTMVALPFTTQLLTNEEYANHGATAAYAAVLLLSSLSLHLMAWHGRRTPQLLHESAEVHAWLARPASWATVILLAGILVVVLVFPALGAWPFLLMFLDNAIEAARARRRTTPAERVPG